MNTLAPKLVLTPLLVATTSLAGRRWGVSLSGWLVALPLTSGPIALFIALEAGVDVARQAAGGSLLGATGQVAFAATYTLASRRVGWMSSVMAGAIAFFLVGSVVPPMVLVLNYALLLLAVAVLCAR